MTIQITVKIIDEETFEVKKSYSMSTENKHYHHSDVKNDIEKFLNKSLGDVLDEDYLF